MDAEAPRELIMHDLVHELVSIITTNEFIVLDADATKPRNWKRAIHCRHAQLDKYKKQPSVFRDMPGKLRSLHFRNCPELQFPKKALSRSKYMRILDLSPPKYTGGSIRLPSSIHKMKLLRYFDVTGLPITSLPKSFPKLLNMQTLIMSNCSLKTLPKNISNLQKLRYLDLSGNRSLKHLPRSLGKLSKFSFLNLLGCSLLEELPESICELACLETLDMSKCCDIQKLPDKFGSLVGLKSLKHLNLSSCHKLENLPHDFGNLVELQLLNLSDCYKISVLPESFCQLTQLKDLNLSDCHDLKELPCLFGELSNLHSLNLTCCSKLQLLPESLCQLINLRRLNLSHCIRLRELPSSLGKLNHHMLDITCAMVLEGLPDGLDTMSSLNQFEYTKLSGEVINKAKDIRENLKLHGRKIHIVHQIENKTCSSIVELAQVTTCRELDIEQLIHVRDPEDGERVKLREKSDLRQLSLNWGTFDDDMLDLRPEIILSYLRDAAKEVEKDKHLLERLVPPRGLEMLLLYGYRTKDFPKWMSDISFYLPSLSSLMVCDLKHCDTFPPFGQLPNLRSLYLAYCPKIRKIGREFYGDGGTCTKLRQIDLKSMENLMEWWTTQSGGENGEFLIPNLHSLSLQDCPQLKFVPYPPRSMIWQLNNSNEVFPEGGFGKPSSYVVPFKMAIRNCNLSANIWHNLQHFATLEDFTVHSCSSLRALPEVIGCFTILKELCLMSLKELRALPECLGRLTLLEKVLIIDCPKLTSLPDSMKNLTALARLFLVGCEGLEMLPEWIGHLTCLEELNIVLCPNLTSLPESIPNLITLRKLYIQGCPILVRRCQGEDATKISHLPEVTLLGANVSLLMANLLRMTELGSTSEDVGALSSRDAGPSTYGDDGASTSRDARAWPYGDDGASNSGDAGTWTYGDAGASTSGDAGASA